MTVPNEQGREEGGTPEPTANRRRDARLVVTGILLALGVWFALANTREVNIRFWVFNARTPVVTALAVAAAIGAVIGVLVGRRFGRHSS